MRKVTGAQVYNGGRGHQILDYDPRRDRCIRCTGAKSGGKSHALHSSKPMSGRSSGPGIKFTKTHRVRRKVFEKATGRERCLAGECSARHRHKVKEKNVPGAPGIGVKR